jgi:hypothetical protein
MANDSFKVKKSLNIEADGTLDSSGDVGVSSNKLHFHNGTTSAAVVTESHTQTLTNKTIDADSNTITNIDNADIKAGADIARNKLASGTASHVVINDGSGVLSSEATLAKSRGGTGADNSSVTFPSTGTIVTRDATETLTNKTINGSSNTITNVSLTTGVTGTLPVGNGGTGLTSPGTSGNVLTSDGTSWTSATPAAAPTSPSEVSNLGLATSVSSNALTIALKQSDGSTDPSSGASAVKIGIRSSTASSGAYNQRSVTSSLSITISSGSTLGHANATNSYIYVYALDNAGTVELAVSSVRYDDGVIVSTTAEGGAGGADSVSAIYSTTARSNVPIRLIGRLVSNQTTAGTWAANMTQISVWPHLYPVESISALYKTSAGQSITSSAATIVFATKSYDTHNCMNTATGEYTLPASGIYRISGLVTTASVTLSTTNPLFLDLYKAGSLESNLNATLGNSATTNFRTAGTVTFQGTTGDVITLRAGTGTNTTLFTNAAYNYFSIDYIGPKA